MERVERPKNITRMMMDGLEEKTSSPENDEYRRVIIEEQLPRVKGKASGKKREFKDAAEATAHVKSFALESGARQVAVCRINQDWVYKGIEIPYKFGIILLMEMDYEKIAQAPDPPAGIEATRTYMALGETTIRLGEHLREIGHDAMIHHPRGDRYSRGELMFVPHAIAAGLGEHGRNGLLINYDFGPRVRLGMVSTDLELVVDTSKDMGLSKFCNYCIRCHNSCPVQAVPLKRAVVRGQDKFTIDSEMCSTFFEETDGCGVCIRDCIFNQRTVEATHNIVNRVASWYGIVKANPRWPQID